MNEFLVLQWFKALHIAFMVAWFAGIFYLPRIFVYHAESSESVVHEQFKVMERRLLYFVTPFALLTIAFGFGIIWIYGADWFRMSGWLHIKLLLVALLVVYHAYCFVLLADFKANRNRRSGKWYRVFNEVPVILLFAIVILAVLQP
ncbi:CopD family protein [Aliidiomarina halalkaliphila]|uniref:Protoporphyrinogen IX oxidase n=1 Tax=Aliidiomarina halalkaliphila TaxID=2593535 RepID=A0A552WZB6_9GAMM|nr:CopD family protein [Aliidiomarina halalkaliphila]TRW48162.1 CopD family protein [Aliidiomarina halalkaliphila]